MAPKWPPPSMARPTSSTTMSTTSLAAWFRSSSTRRLGRNAVAEKEIDIAYNADSTIASIDRYLDSQLVVEGDYSYDQYGRLVGLVYHQGETVLNSYSWTYSSSGQWAVWPLDSRPSTLDTVWRLDARPRYQRRGRGDREWRILGPVLVTSMTSNDGTASYSYDPTGQLLAATYSSPNPEIPESQNPESHSYDANGNRTNTGYVIGADNRLLSDGTYTYAYDAEGNRTLRFIDVDQSRTLTTGDTEITEYTWDARNRLTEVRDYATYTAYSNDSPTQVVDYLYDVENRWIGENIDSDGDGVVDHETRFAYDGNQIVLQFDGDCPDFAQQNGTVPFTLDENGNPQLTASNLSHRYLWQANAVDQLMADEQLSPLPPGEGQVGQRGLRPIAARQRRLAAGRPLGTIRDLAIYDETAPRRSPIIVSTIQFGNLNRRRMRRSIVCSDSRAAARQRHRPAEQRERRYDAKTGGGLAETRLDCLVGMTEMGIGAAATRQRTRLTRAAS